MDLKLPQRYHLEPDPLLGQGGMGRVLRVRDTILDVPVALKIVRPSLAADPRFRRKFDLEVRISARFAHPRIVPLHDHGETLDGIPFLGMAYADAGSFAALRHAPLPWGSTRRLVLELLDALAHLHARDVLHRDLKPENVLLHRGPDGRPHVWLADLGLASIGADVIRDLGRTEGTEGYMAPEQALGQPREYGPWTDLFSLGVILWELITGALPFDDDQPPDATPLPAFRPRIAVPQGLDTVLVNLLCPEPLGRYDLAADLRAELGALVHADRHPDDPIRPPRRGTVAPSVPAPLLEEPDGEEVGDDDDITFTLDPDEVAAVRSTPLWNRPLPPGVPERVPPPVDRAGRVRASLQLFALRDPPLVAREAVRQVLWDHAREVADTARGRVIVLVGEAGSGKSRVMADLASTLEEGGWAQSVRLSYHRDPTDQDGYAGAARALLRPWNEQRASLEARLRRRLAREQGWMDASVRSDAAVLARWCGLLEEGEPPVPFGVGLREIYRHLEAREWRGLSCLLLDDVHWASDDGDGLQIPEALLRRWKEGTDQRLLVVVSVGAEELAAHEDLRERIDELVLAGAIRLQLPRLDRAGTEALLRETLSLTPELVARVAALCEGNPLFARQLLLHWAERGWLVDVGGLRFGLDDGVDVSRAMPPDASAMFRLRIETLAQASGAPERFREAVHLAALSGRSLPQRLLEALVGFEQIEFAMGCGLWVPRGGRLEFESGLLHQAVRAEVEARSDVRRLHLRLGRAWSRLGASAGETFELEAGKHAAAAGASALAIPLLIKACAVAGARGRTSHLDQTSRWLLDAIKRAPSPRPEAPIAALWRGRALAALGREQRAEAMFLRARDGFAAQGDTHGWIQGQIGLGWARLRQGQLAAAEQLFTEAIEAARASGAGPLESRGIAAKAWLEQKKRNFRGADILFAGVLARCAARGDARGAGEALLGQGYVARRVGAFADARELYAEATDTLRDSGDLLGVAQAQLGLATVERQLRQWARSEALSREAAELCGELGAISLLMEARHGMAELARLRGELARAERLYREHVRHCERNQAFEGVIFASLGLALISLEHGLIASAHRQAGRASEVLRQVPGHWLWATHHLIVATLHAQEGEHTQTWRWLWAASELGLRDTVDLDTARCLEVICGIAGEQEWDDVLRVAGKPAVLQLSRLGLDDQAQRLQQQLDALER